jgi:uncharacterized protein YdeI (BOF family)
MPVTLAAAMRGASCTGWEPVMVRRLLQTPGEPLWLLEDMLKKILSLSSLVTLAIVLGMISWGSALSAQTTPSTPPDQQTTSQSPDAAPSQQTPQTQPTPSPEMPPAAQQAPQSQSPDATTPESGSKSSGRTGSAAAGTDSQTFSGTVVKQGDKYVLKDDSGKIYDIDHQTDVAKFEGKRVRVQGTLDANGKILVK